MIASANDTNPMRDRYGTCLHVGDTVTRMKLKNNRSGWVPVWVGYVAEVRLLTGELRALVQPHGSGDALWLKPQEIEAQNLVPVCLEGTMADWV